MLLARAVAATSRRRLRGHADLTWLPRPLPVPAGRAPIVQAAVWCGDRWYAAGATADARGDTGPRYGRAPTPRPGDPCRSSRCRLLRRPRHPRLGRLLGTAGWPRSARSPAAPTATPGSQTWRQLRRRLAGRRTRVPPSSTAARTPSSVTRLSGGTDQGYLVDRAPVAGRWRARVELADRGRVHAARQRARPRHHPGGRAPRRSTPSWWQGSWTVVGDADARPAAGSSRRHGRARRRSLDAGCRCPGGTQRHDGRAGRR